MILRPTSLAISCLRVDLSMCFSSQVNDKLLAFFEIDFETEGKDPGTRERETPTHSMPESKREEL